MKIEQRKWTRNSGWQLVSKQQLKKKPQLVLVFGGREQLKEKKQFQVIKDLYPSANLLSCSTAGEILGTEVLDDSLCVTAIAFEKTKLGFSEVTIKNAEKSYAAGKKLASAMAKKELSHVMVFSDGLKVNGTSLVKGILEELPNVAVTGGLVGDGPLFKETVVGLNKVAKSGVIVMVGFYGNSLKVGYGSLGGWDPFGPERKITKSKGNILYELDGKPALKLYKEYLGEKAKGLPGTGLLFPLSLEINGKGKIVRTILAVDEKAQSITFAGDMPEGVSARLMKANFERLIDGAGGAAKMSSLKNASPELAILISCIGRKLVLKERVEEEVEAVQEMLGKKTSLTGFYSYGEISPAVPTSKQCQLHNQTMTITTFKEG